MGFKNVLKKIGKATLKGAERVAKNLEWNEEVESAKRRILSRFSVKQLERIAESEGISLYLLDIPFEEPIRITSKKGIVDRIASNLSLEEVIDLARRYKVRYTDVVQRLEMVRERLFESPESEEEEECEETLESEDEDIEKVIKAIKEFTLPKPVRREKELQGRLASWLASRFGSHAVKEDYPFDEGEVDIVIWDSIAIELKIARGRQALKNLIGEVKTDRKFFDKVVAVIFDAGRDVNLPFYKEEIKDLGAKAVIIPIQLRRKGKSRREEIIIERGKGRIVIR